MRPPLVVVFVVVVILAAVVPRAAAVCVLRKPGAAGIKPPSAPKPKVPVPASAQPKPLPGGDLVKALCGKTSYPDVCVSSIAKQPASPGRKKLDGAGVLRLAMGAVRSKGAEAKKAAGSLAADPKTTALARGPLEDCEESYDDINYSLDQADKAIVAGDKDTTGTMLDTVRTDVDTCDQGFQERAELTPLMSKYDGELAKLSSNCLAIATAAGIR